MCALFKEEISISVVIQIILLELSKKRIIQFYNATKFHSIVSLGSFNRTFCTQYFLFLCRTGVDVINKFKCSLTTLCRNKAL